MSKKTYDVITGKKTKVKSCEKCPHLHNNLTMGDDESWMGCKLVGRSFTLDELFDKNIPAKLGIRPWIDGVMSWCPLKDDK